MHFSERSGPCKKWVGGIPLTQGRSARERWRAPVAVGAETSALRTAGTTDILELAEATDLLEMVITTALSEISGPYRRNGVHFIADVYDEREKSWIR